MKFRPGTESDLDLLAQWNYQLIHDEGHRNPMSLQQLRDRMNAWIKGEYRAIIFETEKEPVAYALYRESSEDIYLRQLFVKRGLRGKGIGRSSLDILQTQLWPSNKRLTVEVLTSNEQSIQFCRSVGFTDYSLTLEIMPKDSGE